MSQTPKCQRCERECRDSFLCQSCSNHIREILRELPWWLDHLLESSVGQVRMGDGGRSSARQELHGEDLVTEHAITIAQAAAMGRANIAASRLYARAHNTLATWIRDICESRGIDYRMQIMESNFIGPMAEYQQRRGPRKDPGTLETSGTHTPMALWLAKHAPAIAMHEAAGECARDIADLRQDVERLINRRESLRYCGPCPTEIAEGHAECDREHPHDCGTRLQAQQKASSVTCPSCKASHEVEALQRKIFEENADFGYEAGEILTAMNAMGMSVGESTLRRWIAQRALLPMNWHSGTPRYHLDDVRKLREKGQHAVTKR